MTRIVFVTPQHFHADSYMGGGERYPLNLARGVARAADGAMTVDLITFGDEEHALDIEPGLTMRVLRSDTGAAGAAGAVSWGLVPLVRDADLVHIHQVFSRCGETAALTARMWGKPVCVTDHGGASSRLGMSLQILDLATRVICYSDFGASMLRTRSPVRVVKGGVDTLYFAPPTDGGPRTHVLYVGRLLAHKGIDRLIVAMPPELPLVVCGQPYDAAYLATLRALARGKRITFVTDADDQMLRHLYHHALAVVLPSVHRDSFGKAYSAPELMGLSLLEGMACGAPAVCARTAAMPEFVEDGVSGFVYDTIGELRSHLELLAGDAARRDVMGAAARAFAVRHDILAVGRRMVDVYGEAMAAN